MGARGCASDNAVCEAFFTILKSELVDRRSWPTKAEARQALFDFIETFYNRRRCHSTRGYLSPAEYEKISNWRPVTPRPPKATSRQVVYEAGRVILA